MSSSKAYATAWASFFSAKWIGHIFLTSQGVATAGQVMKAETYTLLLFVALQMSVGLGCQLQAEHLGETLWAPGLKEAGGVQELSPPGLGAAMLLHAAWRPLEA